MPCARALLFEQPYAQANAAANVNVCRGQVAPSLLRRLLGFPAACCATGSCKEALGVPIAHPFARQAHPEVNGRPCAPCASAGSIARPGRSIGSMEACVHFVCLKPGSAWLRPRLPHARPASHTGAWAPWDYSALRGVGVTQLARRRR